MALKRRKTVGGLRPSKSSPISAVADNTGSDSDVYTHLGQSKPDNGTKRRVRQFHIDSRFPQRRNPAKDTAVPVMQPTSIDKLISGIWRQLHSPIDLSLLSGVCSGLILFGLFGTNSPSVSGTGSRYTDRGQ